MKLSTQMNRIKRACNILRRENPDIDKALTFIQNVERDMQIANADRKRANAPRKRKPTPPPVFENVDELAGFKVGQIVEVFYSRENAEIKEIRKTERGPIVNLQFRSKKATATWKMPELRRNMGYARKAVADANQQVNGAVATAKA